MGRPFPMGDCRLLHAIFGDYDYDDMYDYDNPGSRDFNTLHQLASSNTKASRFSLIISVTKAPLNEPTIEVMNTTMDTVSFGTLLMDDPGGFWPNGKGCAIYDYDYDVYRGG